MPKTLFMIKKLLICLICLLVISNKSEAQIEKKFNLSIAKGDIIVDGYYGFLTFHKAGLLFIASQVSAGYTDYSYSGYGPIGGRVEYMVSDMIGLGMEFNYANDNIVWQEGNYNYDYNVTRMRIFPRLNIHFSEDEKLDAYFSIGAGYREVIRSMSSDRPNFYGYSHPAFIPIAIRLAVGVRYFFTDHVGLAFEAGFGGGALLHPGLSFKF